MRDPTSRPRHTHRLRLPPKALMTTALLAVTPAGLAGNYTAADGDRLPGIARARGISVQGLERANGPASGSLRSGQQWVLSAERRLAAEGDDDDGDSDEHATTESRLAAAGGVHQAAAGGSGGNGRKDADATEGEEQTASSIEQGQGDSVPQQEAAADAAASEAESPSPENAHAADQSAAAECGPRTAGQGAHEDQPHWAYEGEAGPEHWAELSPQFEKCGTGARQTPIDLASGEVVPMGLEDVEFQYGTAEATVLNNGHTIQVNVSEGNGIVLDGASYGMVQFHFHTPSEHTIDGASYPLELHLVHKDKDGNLAVVGVLLEKGEKNPVLSQVWGKSLPKTEGRELALKTPIDLNGLLPSDRAAYRYLGSLTTPPCSEGVKWIVMKSSVTMTTRQIAAFKKIFPMNARPLQPINARSIVEDVTDSTHAAN
ncbi:MAG: hypothetical protein HONDAALG_00280 [Gammaproteobacteria bacterium]|nr:hypothetical protein [Gammaproteobacteria bacterium]